MSRDKVIRGKGREEAGGRAGDGGGGGGGTVDAGSRGRG